MCGVFVGRCVWAEEECVCVCGRGVCVGCVQVSSVFT